MNRQDIEKAALNMLNSFDAEYIYHKDYASKESFCEGFVMGAEWMDEQFTKVCVMETSNTDNVSDNDLIEECKRRGIFNKERNKLIKKAQQWAEDWFCNGEEWMRRTDFIEGVKNEIKQAMKGE